MAMRAFAFVCYSPKLNTTVWILRKRVQIETVNMTFFQLVRPKEREFVQKEKNSQMRRSVFESEDKKPVTDKS